jgi:hypothetical protein
MKLMKNRNGSRYEARFEREANCAELLGQQGNMSNQF